MPHLLLVEEARGNGVADRRVPRGIRMHIVNRHVGFDP